MRYGEAPLRGVWALDAEVLRLCLWRDEARFPGDPAVERACCCPSSPPPTAAAALMLLLLPLLLRGKGASRGDNPGGR